RMNQWPTLSSWIARKGFTTLEHLNLHLTPVHFYSPIPDTREISEEFWQENSELTGIELNEAAQISLLNRFVAQYRDEYIRFPLQQVNGHAHEYYIQNKRFESVDGEILYCMIRQFKPRRVIEIGSG